MDKFEQQMNEYERKREEERLAFLKKGADKVRGDDDLIYRMMALHLSQRFELGLNWRNEPHNIVYRILNYYIEKIDEDFEEWLNKDNAPIIKPINTIKSIFPELKIFSDDDRKIIKIANSLYGLDIETDFDGFDVDYWYSYEFDFNAFTPINVEEIQKLKTEMMVLAKYGYDTSKIEEELQTFGLTEEQLEVL